MPVFDFRNQTQCRLSGDITASRTVLPVGPGGSGFLPSSGGVMMAVIRDALGYEVVKITGAAFGQLTVERGQDGSTPKAFNLGAIISARTAKSALGNGIQKGALRQISYNPNAVTMPAYFGEKVAEIGVDGCTHRIWQNVVAGSAQWRIVYGDMCKDLQNYREWDWPDIDVPWPDWPEPDTLDVCGWDSKFVGEVTDADNKIYILHRACAAIATDQLELIVDESGNNVNGIPVVDFPYLPHANPATAVYPKLINEGYSFYRIGIGAIDGYKDTRVLINHPSLGSIYDNTYFIVFRAKELVTGPYYSIVNLEFANSGMSFVYDSGRVSSFSTEHSEDAVSIEFGTPAMGVPVVVCARSTATGEMIVRVNGSQVCSGQGVVNPDHDFDDYTGFLLSAAYQDNSHYDSSTGKFVINSDFNQSMNFDLYNYMWFKSALSDYSMRYIEARLMSAYGVV